MSEKWWISIVALCERNRARDQHVSIDFRMYRGIIQLTFYIDKLFKLFSISNSNK